MLNSFLLNQIVLNGAIGSTSAVVSPSTPAAGLHIFGKAETVKIFGDSRTMNAFGNVKTPEIEGKVQ